MIDYTKLRKKLIPEPDGEPPVVMRTGTVDAVNADGTVDVEMSSGVILPDIPRLADIEVSVGLVVNIISFRGSLLVIGASAGSGTPDLRPIIVTGVEGGGPAAAATSFLVVGVPFGVTFPGVPNVHINLATGSAAANSWVGRAYNITTTAFNLLAYGPGAAGFSGTWQWTAIYVP